MQHKKRLSLGVVLGIMSGLVGTTSAIAQNTPTAPAVTQPPGEYQCPRYFLELSEPRIVIYVLQGTPDGDAIALETLTGEILNKVQQRWPNAFWCERYNRQTTQLEPSIQVATVANAADRDRVVETLRQLLVNIAGVTIHSHGNAATAPPP